MRGGRHEARVALEACIASVGRAPSSSPVQDLPLILYVAVLVVLKVWSSDLQQHLGTC